MKRLRIAECGLLVRRSLGEAGRIGRELRVGLMAVLALCGTGVAQASAPAASEEKLVATDAQIDRLIAEAPARKVALPPQAKAVADKLAAHVLEMAELSKKTHLAPLWYFNGNGEMWVFAQPRETFESLAPALSVLDGPAREAALAMLDSELEKFSPLSVPRGYYPIEGLRRYPFNAGEETRKGQASSPSPPVAVFAAYGLWAYAWYGGREERVLAQWDGLRAAFVQYAARPLQYKYDGNRDAESQLNRAVSAMIGMARLARLAKDEATYAQARAELARLLAVRLPIEADTRLAHVVGNGVALARYWDLSPEVGRLIRELADKGRQEKWINLNAHLIADWYLAWTERPTGVMNPPGPDTDPSKGEYIGSEYFLSNPMFAMSLFSAKALALGDDGATLEKYIDIPWCRGDLNFIAKCTYALRAYAGWTYENTGGGKP